MAVLPLFASLIGLAFTLPAPSWLDLHQVFDNVTIFTAPSNWSSHQTSYARTLILSQNCEEDNVLLATWAFSPPGRPYAPIYESKDGGLSWNESAKVYFSAADGPGAGIAQPFLYELPQQIGNYPAGTILVAGNAIPSNHSSTNIQLYASLDQG